jgi:fructose-specific phosphotransferase system IIC component
MRESVVKVRQYLLSGVSFAIPFIACGGIMIAAAIAVNTHYYPSTPSKMGPATPAWVSLTLNIGVAAFTLMPAVLAGYISNAMAGKPGLVPGFVGGWLATHIPAAAAGDPDVSAGFLGAMVAGLLAGYVVMALKKLPVPRVVKPIMPIMIVPILGSTAVGVVMLWVIGLPIAHGMDGLGRWLESMSHGSAFVLAVLLGCMIAFDMGGPINKTAFFFGSGLITQGHYSVMGAVATAICIPPMGLGLATIVGRKLWTESEREAGAAALAMGCVGITEGAIPFAASDPVRIIPCIMFGSAVGAVIAMLGDVGDHAPHGGPIVIFVVDNKIMYAVAITVGVVTTALVTNLVKQLTTARPAPLDGVEPITAAAA